MFPVVMYFRSEIVIKMESIKLCAEESYKAFVIPNSCFTMTKYHT